MCQRRHFLAPKDGTFNHMIIWGREDDINEKVTISLPDDKYLNTILEILYKYQ
jgi:hypothetical protein